MREISLRRIVMDINMGFVSYSLHRTFCLNYSVIQESDVRELIEYGNSLYFT